MTGDSILVVDDDPSLLLLMQKYLTRMEYKVETCSRSDDAWDLFQARPDRYRLVLADLSLHGLSGEDLLTRMIGLNPQIRFLICSGYPFNVEQLPVEWQPQVGFLQKPFLPKMLSNAIEDLLGNSPL